LSDFCFPPLAFRGKIYPGPQATGQQYDVILVSGDAYVDHPAFPAAVVCRLLQHTGLRVAVISQPDWQKDSDFTVWGTPARFFAIAPGAMDSMVANYTATRMPRSKDRLSPGGEPGLRPKRASQIYSQKVRQLFKKTPVLLGGVEPSMRRFVHYDFWEDKLRNPILFDAPADILLYGMAESAVQKVIGWLSDENKEPLPQIPQTCIKVKSGSWQGRLKQPYEILPSLAACQSDKKEFMKLALIVDKAVRPSGPVLVLQHPKGDIISFPPDIADLNQEFKIMDELKFARQVHPLYAAGVPALEPVQFSLQSHRGCVGACSFCALSLHQGRTIRSRDLKSIVAEAKDLLAHPQFKGTIPDVGGPAVNMYNWEKPENTGSIRPILEVLQAVAQIDGIRHVFLGSGLRYDLLKPEEWQLFEKIVFNFISGQLKVAPEHFDREVLMLMRKGANSDFAAFVSRFYASCRKHKKNLFLVPYLITAFPGSHKTDSLLVKKVKELNLVHEQIQEFTPTPGSLASAMYYCEMDMNFRPLKVLKKRAERLNTRKHVHSYKKSGHKRKK
jgi:radical SAM superfamily enzyme YgiQ (UPF0313 family)